MLGTGKCSGYLSAYVWEKGDDPVNADVCSLELVEKDGKHRAFLLVCDGIRSLEKGPECAGRIQEWATAYFREEMLRLPFTGKHMYQAGNRLLYEICHRLRQKAREEGTNYGASCTLAFLEGEKYALFSRGDTRAYKITNRKTGGTQLLTRDDVAEGKHLTGCIGSFGYEEAEYVTGRLHKGEALLLCTNGFYGKQEIPREEGCGKQEIPREEGCGKQEIPREKVQRGRQKKQGMAWGKLLLPSGIRGEEQAGKRLGEIVRQNRRKGERDHATAIWLSPMMQ